MSSNNEGGPQYERGPKGDHGQQGDTGLVGNSGVSGERGVPGMQGVAGPSGTPGAAGAAGAPGAAGGGGAAGAQGDQGVQGFEGPPGQDSPVIERKRVLVLFAFMVFATMLLGYRSEHNANNIEKIQHNECVNQRLVIQRFNQQQDNLAQLDRDNPVAGNNPEGQKLQAARIALYESAKIPVPTEACPGA